MFERRNIQRTYLKISREVKDFLLSDKSREFFIFLFFFFVAGGFWLLQTLNNDYEADFSIPVRLKGVPNNVVITSEPASELRIKVKDKGTVLLNYMLGKSFYPVILDYADYKGVDNQVRIYPSQFEKKVLNQLNASTRLLSMKPDTLEYIYSTGASKLVPVKLRGTLSAGREYYLSDTIFSPPPGSHHCRHSGKGAPAPPGDRPGLCPFRRGDQPVPVVLKGAAGQGIRPAGPVSAHSGRPLHGG